MYLVDPTDSDARFIAEHIRTMDRLECEALGQSPAAALAFGMAASAWIATAMVDQVPLAMLGVVSGDDGSSIGTVWLLGTDAFSNHGLGIVRLWPLVKHNMQKHASILTNIVACQNAPAIRLLKYLGFTIDDREICISSVDFFRFKQEI